MQHVQPQHRQKTKAKQPGRDDLMAAVQAAAGLGGHEQQAAAADPDVEVDVGEAQVETTCTVLMAVTKHAIAHFAADPCCNLSAPDYWRHPLARASCSSLMPGISSFLSHSEYVDCVWKTLSPSLN